MKNWFRSFDTDVVGTSTQAQMTKEYEEMIKHRFDALTYNTTDVAAQQGPRSFKLDDRARVAMEIAKALIMSPGMLIVDADDRAERAVKEADALIKALAK